MCLLLAHIASSAAFLLAPYSAGTYEFVYIGNHIFVYHCLQQPVRKVRSIWPMIVKLFLVRGSRCSATKTNLATLRALDERLYSR
ncbi:hypothetical protein Plhal304r1_c018g0064221 [Plasmopara halstedii]